MEVRWKVAPSYLLVYSRNIYSVSILETEYIEDILRFKVKVWLKLLV